MASIVGDHQRSAWFDRIITPLNACSLETYVPVTISTEEDVAVDASSSSCGVGSTITSTVGRRRRRNENNEVVVPLVIGCYQLNEQSSDICAATSATPTDDDNVKASSSSRSGELRLYMISPSSSSSSATPSSSLSDDDDGSQQQEVKNSNVIKFGNASCVVQMESGVLDGKWQRRRRMRSRDNITTTQSTTGNIYGGDGSSCYYESSSPLFASACASGKIHLHSLEKKNNVEQQEESTTSWTLSHVTSSNQPDGEPICLSLAWNDFMNDDDDTNTLTREDQIVSSYSNGTVALHNLVYSTNCTTSSNYCNNDNDNNNIINMEETHRWNAHNMFGCPSEVWTCSFLKGNTNVVLSGADDGTLKSWDVRNTQRHIHKIGGDNAEFEAGVTSISSHPTLDHVFAMGSYDEYVRIYDYRRMDNKEPMAKVHVGGGVWRMKWHPSCWEDDDDATTTSTYDRRDNNSGKILVAAMHGGCRIVNIPGLGNSTPDDNNNAVEILSQFTAHESMAYGADWISFGKCKEAVAASCSFYDRQAFLWGPSDSYQ